jgi:hypothetical protein
MSSWDFIISNIRFSYSSTSAFDNCPYSFKLTYLEAMPRENNFFSEYGTLVHECFEKYFTGKVEGYELSQYYIKNYDSVVKTPLVGFSPGLGDKYRQQGQTFFDYFSFNKEDYEILFVEDKIDTDLNNTKIVAKPDLVLKEKTSKKIILYDYKTATPFWENRANGKEMSDKKKIEAYYKQMLLYTYALRKGMSIPVNEITLWFVRLDKRVTIPWELEKENKAVLEFDEIVNKIKAEEVFAYNNSNSFFCNNLCGVRSFCKYK